MENKQIKSKPHSKNLIKWSNIYERIKKWRWDIIATLLLLPGILIGYFAFKANIDADVIAEDANKIAKESNIIANESLICSKADSKLKEAKEFVKKQKQCNLSVSKNNEDILTNASVYLINGSDCNKIIKSLEKLNFKICEEFITGYAPKEITVVASSFLILTVIIFIVLVGYHYFHKKK